MSSTLEAQGIVGKLVRREREARGWSLADLAWETGIGKSFLSKLERGQVSPTVTTLERLADGFASQLVIEFVEKPKRRRKKKT